MIEWVVLGWMSGSLIVCIQKYACVDLVVLLAGVSLHG